MNGMFRNLLGGVVIMLCSCQAETRGSDRGSSIEQTPSSPTTPQTRQQFVDLLQPLPAPAVQVIYEVEGPAHLTGRLEVLVQRGGLRREDWVVSLPVPGEEPVEVTGRTIRTLDRLWSVSDGQDALLTRSPLGALASAYVKLPLDQRRQVAEALRTWNRQVERAAADDPSGKTVAGQPCQLLDMAAQSVCLWRTTGMPLLYRSEGFQLRAIGIDLDPKVGPERFELPVGAADAPVSRTADPFSPEQALAALVQGHVASVLLALQSVSRFTAGAAEPASSPAADEQNPG